MATLPLSGIRVIDLTHHVVGPFCTRVLTDYGAAAIKIEEPSAGDPARRLGPFFKDRVDLESSGLFLYLNTNKRSLLLNLKTERGKAILKELVRDAHVLVENFHPRVMPSLGLDYEALSAINPRLVMTSISNFGQTGPYRDWSGTELTLWAMGGPMNATGNPEREPLRIAGRVSSFHVGHVAALATAMALWKAELTGRGEHVDVSFFEAWMGSVDRRTTNLLTYQHTGATAKRPSPASALATGVYPCSDGYFFLDGAAYFGRMARMIGAESLLESPEWEPSVARSNTDRIDEFNAILVPWMLEHTKGEVRALCQENGVVGGPINTVEDLLADAHFQARGYFQEIEHPVTGTLTYPGYNFTLHTGEPKPLRQRAPLLGEHTEEVLCGELGYSKNELTLLREQGVI